jgi:S-DNA-T family DNA segregation ATPase FtsK/SpoIIIE
MMKTYRLIKEENNVRNRNYIRIKEGIKKINRKKILILIPIMYFLIIGCLTYAGEWLLGKMGSPFSTELYLVIFYALMIVLLSAGMIGILCMLGTPIKSKKIEGQLIDIGFTDKEGNAPILLSKEKDKKGIKFEFYSPKISFVKYEDHISDIETALNIKVVDIRPGKDIQHVVIRSIQSGKENKDMLLWKDEYLSDKDFEFVLGESYFGSESINISGTPHILIGGASGSGKSKLLKSILMQAKKKEAIVILADMKGGVDYPTIWHKKCTIITDPNNLKEKLDDVLVILEERRKLLVEAGTPNISEYNAKTGLNLCRIIVACDEVAEVLDKTGLDKDQKAIINQIEANFSTIARLGRAFGIHLIFATQRPDADILKGQIKNNIGYRICGRADKVLSQIILDNSEASDKISPNDQGMFLMNTGVLFKAYYVEDDCLEGVDINGETAG